MAAAAGAGVSGLVPQPFERLLARLLRDLDGRRGVYGLPARSTWSPREGLDLSVALPSGRRAATPLGPAAGPHTQLAPNLVAAWLGGSRVLELKTVQALDRLEVPRPCIDAPGPAWNVEWSQELRLEDSARQYAIAWMLVHVLRARGVGGGAAAETVFDASAGYDLAGLRSEPVARFLDTMRDGAALLGELRDSLPAALRRAGGLEAPVCIADTVTLSTFHGCPPDEIERMVEHLFERHAMHVVVKLNPTLLGYDEVDAILHGPLGWQHVALDRAAFERDLQWEHALELIGRLRAAALRHGRSLGVKLTNTLVVRNTRGRLAGEAVYLSGAPLHPIALRLADRIARATGGRIPMALSAGVNAENFTDAVACGFQPVTTCTDLLRPTGYRRLPRYLKALVADMERTGSRTVEGHVIARATERGAIATTARTAALENLSAYAAGVIADARYSATIPAGPPAERAPLELMGCESCNRCTLVCPNGAFFDVAAPLQGGMPGAAAAGRNEREWMVLADFCNSCGNCDTWCPQSGGPDRMKARLHTSHAHWLADPSPNAILAEPDGRIRVRADGPGAGVASGDARAALGWLRALGEHALQEHGLLRARLTEPPSGDTLTRV